MALSLAVLLVPILLIIAVARFFYGDTTTTTVDPGVALSAAARASMAPLPQPAAPDGWKIVNARFQQGVLRIGYVTAQQRGVQLVQSATTAPAFVRAELTDAGRQAGQTRVAGQTWQRWTGRPGESALVRQAGGTTIIVVGAVGETDLATLASAAGVS
jgi:hypothetical protein